MKYLLRATIVTLALTITTLAGTGAPKLPLAPDGPPNCNPPPSPCAVSFLR